MGVIIKGVKGGLLYYFLRPPTCQFRKMQSVVKKSIGQMWDQHSLSLLLTSWKAQPRYCTSPTTQLWKDVIPAHGDQLFISLKKEQQRMQKQFLFADWTIWKWNACSYAFSVNTTLHRSRNYKPIQVLHPLPDTVQSYRFTIHKLQHT